MARGGSLESVGDVEAEVEEAQCAKLKANWRRKGGMHKSIS